jgi:hypothetical protein
VLDVQKKVREMLPVFNKTYMDEYRDSFQRINKQLQLYFEALKTTSTQEAFDSIVALPNPIIDKCTTDDASTTSLTEAPHLAKPTESTVSRIELEEPLINPNATVALLQKMAQDDFVAGESKR